MNRYKFKYLITVLTFITLGYMFSGGDCGTDNEDPPATSVAAPGNVKVSLDQASGSFAVVSWSHSADQGRSDFKGYRVVTYEVDSAGNVLSVFDIEENIPKTSTTQIVNSIDIQVRYRSYVTAVLNNNVRSDSVATKIYAAVIANSGLIDEYQVSGAARSGYGWNPELGIFGNQYEFTTANAGRIDLHMRNEGGTGLRFYSPNAFSPGTRITTFATIGAGQAAFDQTDLIEATETSAAVVADNVYLLKLQSNHYAKVWVKQIQTVSGYQQVSFDWKVQPIAGLRVLKN